MTSSTNPINSHISNQERHQIPIQARPEHFENIQRISKDYFIVINDVPCNLQAETKFCVFFNALEMRIEEQKLNWISITRRKSNAPAECKNRSCLYVHSTWFVIERHLTIDPWSGWLHKIHDNPFLIFLVELSNKIDHTDILLIHALESNLIS